LTKSTKFGLPVSLSVSQGGVCGGVSGAAVVFVLVLSKQPSTHFLKLFTGESSIDEVCCILLFSVSTGDLPVGHIILCSAGLGNGTSRFRLSASVVPEIWFVVGAAMGW
jgi:hypothetical protein